MSLGRDVVLHFIASVASLAAAGFATAMGYWQARKFTTNKLRYVDAVHGGMVPVVVGVIAAIIAAPVVWLLPIVGTGTALLFGGGVGFGVASGARDIRRRIGSG